jgi:hypothetical protein
MIRVQQLRPGEKVPRSGIYQESLTKRRATLVKGEPAPPTPHKAGQWQQVVATESPTDPCGRTGCAVWGFAVGVFLTRWVGSAKAPRGQSAMRRPKTRRPLRGHGLRSGSVIAFSSGMVLGLLVAPALAPRKPQPSEQLP